MAQSTNSIIAGLAGAGNLSVVRLSSSKQHYDEILAAAHNHEGNFSHLEPTSDRLILIIERNVQGGCNLVDASTPQRS